MSSGDSKSGLLKNFLSLSVVQFANNILPLITVPYIVRIIGPDHFGAINFTAAIILYFTLFINYGFDLTATREIAKNKDDKSLRNSIFSNVLYAKILLLMVSITIFLILLYTLPELAAEKPLAIFNFLFVFSLVLTPNWLFQGMQELYNIAICNLVAKLSFTICVLIVIQEPEDYIFQPLIFSIAAIVVGVLAFTWSVYKYKIKIHKPNFNQVAKTIWSDKTVFFSLILINIYTTINIIVLGILQSNHDVALFSASWKLITVAQTLITLPFSLSLFPYIGENFGISREQGLDKVKQLAPLIIILTAVAGFVLWLVAPLMIGLFYGPDFSNSIAVFRILCFIPMIAALSNLLGVQTMVNLKMDQSFFRILAIGAVVGLGLSLLFVNQLGYVGAAWAWLLTEILITVTLWGYLYSKKIQILDLTYFRYEYLSEISRPIVSMIKQKIYK